MPGKLRALILLAGGVLLVALGVLHLGVTPFIGRMLRGSMSAEAADWLVAPMLLNHVVVGILLLPLGFLIAYAALPAADGARWAVVVVRVAAAAVAVLPVVLFVLMGTRYFEAVPFVVATSIVCVASVVMLVAAFWPAPRAGR